MTSAVRKSHVMSFTFYLVSHYKGNAVLNIAASNRFIQNLFKDVLVKKKMIKQHFDIIVGKLTISFIVAGYPGLISTLDAGLTDLFDVDMIHSVLRLVTFCTNVLSVRKDKYSTKGTVDLQEKLVRRR